MVSSAEAAVTSAEVTSSYSAHVDTFARDHLPPIEQWPEFLFERPELQYPRRLNCVSHFLDRWIENGRGDQPCAISLTENYSYREFQSLVNRIANVLVGELGLVTGGRVLLRSANNPMMVATYMAVLKAGGIVVATMPLLRAKELVYPIAKAKITLALCDQKLSDEMEKARAVSSELRRVVYWGTDASDGLDALIGKASPDFTAADTASDDVCLIAFTSGTTGDPKGTVHFHRDMLAVCDSYAHHVLQARHDDRFISSAPLAFTFGFGGVMFPMHIGASFVVLEKAGPDDLPAAIERFKVTVCFTAPTSYRAMLATYGNHNMSSLRKCVSAGENLPKPTFDAWHKKTGLKLMDGIGATEMLHIFISATEDEIRPGATGKPVPGYEAKIVDDDGRDVSPGTMGRLAVRGPTGCRYLADPRQKKFVQNGWNITGDTYLQDEDGYFWYQSRSDDMIISAGYNIAGPDVEAALLTHDAVVECGVVGAPDETRGMIVKAYVVLAPGISGDATLTGALQDHVKREIAPYKYPRAIEFVTHLPKTESGKLKRFSLRQIANGADVRPARRLATDKLQADTSRILQPSGWPTPKGYANGMTAQGRIVVTGGVIGWDAQERLQEDFAGQVGQALRNIAAILKEGGAGPKHLVRLTWYVVDLEEYLANLKPLGAAYREIFGTHYPAMALVQVVRLVEKRARVEIEATAVVPLAGPF